MDLDETTVPAIPTAIGLSAAVSPSPPLTIRRGPRKRDAPRSWDNLLNPKWKGKIALKRRMYRRVRDFAQAGAGAKKK
jgi:ABC-type Fe3+ transport system substrate-binding protein